jgi:hypothetical protein
MERTEVQNILQFTNPKPWHSTVMFGGTRKIRNVENVVKTNLQTHFESTTASGVTPGFMSISARK